MTGKTGRNDPCHCSSGKKYKHCCGRSAAPAVAAADAHEGAAERALAWLAQHHRRAMAAALNTAIDDAAAEIFGDEDEARAAIAGMSEELWDQLRLNLTEWLLAEGDLKVNGTFRRVAELVLGTRGPSMTGGQRAWLEQLARRPLRLYDITEVVPDACITLCDALLTDQPPRMVSERSASRSLRVGMQIGAHGV